jgi:hypothetical protein
MCSNSLIFVADLLNRGGRVSHEYPEKWNEISGIFSKESVLRGDFDRYADSALGKRGTSQVDAEFLREIEEWREH